MRIVQLVNKTYRSFYYPAIGIAISLKDHSMIANVKVANMFFCSFLRFMFDIHLDNPLFSLFLSLPFFVYVYMCVFFFYIVRYVCSRPHFITATLLHFLFTSNRESYTTRNGFSLSLSFSLFVILFLLLLRP